MDSKQKRILSWTMGCVLLAWLIFSFASCRREPVFPLSGAPLLFNASNSYRITQEFVTKNPLRVLGSLEARQSSGYLQDCLETLGYEVSFSDFNARIGRREVGRNILGFKQGRIDEIIALVAHYDTARTTVQGAMNNGAGVGVLLELAGILSTKPTKRSILMALSDGEEWGMLGIQDLVSSYPRRDRLVAALSLDHVSVSDLAAFRLQTAGQMKGFTPPWLRQLATQAARESGLPVLSPSGVQEHFERALLLPLSDQGPFLGAGTPAINLGSKSTDSAFEKAVYHSSQDKIANLKIASIEQFGKTAERILYSLDDLHSMPRESAGYFRVADSFYLSPASISLLHVILFLPPLLIFFFHLKYHRKDFSPVGFGREILAFMETAIPLLIIFFLIGLCRLLRALPVYSVYPATAKDPLLENPHWGVLGSILGTVFFIGLICYAIGKFSFRSYPKPNFYASKTVLLGITIALIVLSLFHNSYWATLFLLIPSWVWALADRGVDKKSKIVHSVLMLAAGITFYIFLWSLGSRLGLSWKLIWYQMLALNSGMFTPTGFFLGVAAIALGIRFIAIQSHSAEEPLRSKSGTSIVLNLKK
jgi:hypothetical protein